MTLEAAYKQFLAAPNPAALAEHASLHYITTLTTFNDPANILKHLKTQANQIKKKKDNFLDTVEGQNALAAEVETTLEFISSGGTYLPGLDSNFISDRTVTFPIIHIVSFDSDGKITQIRQNWDQGSLLKLIDVIGKTGRNWPIRDGKDQATLIANSVRMAAKPGSATNGSRQHSNHQTQGSHASDGLFAPRDEVQRQTFAAPVSTRNSARPAQRDFNELFVGHESDNESTTAGSNRGRSTSPNKVIAPKGGTGKSYKPSHLFDNVDNSASRPAVSEKAYKSSTYQPLDFDGSNAALATTQARAAPKNNHGAHWDFDDFNSPAKHVPGKVPRGPEVRQWAPENDGTPNSPVYTRKVDKPRKDSEAHFDFMDDGEPQGGRRAIGRPRGPGMDNRESLYQNNLYGDGGAPPAEATERTLVHLANVKDRRKDFDPHFQLTDESAYDQSQNENQGSVASQSRPGTSKVPLSETTNPSQRTDGIRIAGDGMGGRKGADKKSIQNKGINIGGDGMGGRKGATKMWGFGDDDSDHEDKKPRHISVQKDSVSTGGDFWNY